MSVKKTSVAKRIQNFALKKEKKKGSENCCKIIVFVFWLNVFFLK